ncbi:MAG: VWA domain-containing protein [Terriglobales bacterium]
MFLAAASCLAAQQPQILTANHPYLPGVVAIATASNEVEVAVVVSGRNGQPLSGLTRSDFRLFRDGKAERITALRAVGPVPASAKHAVTGQNAAFPRTARSEPQTVALLFDDNSMNDRAMQRARRAARQMIANALASRTRIGIFTVSGLDTVPFTNAAAQLTAGLAALRAHPRMTPENANQGIIPLSPYLAYMVARDPLGDSGYLQIVAHRLLAAGACHKPTDCDFMALDMARAVVDQATLAGHNTLDALLSVIARLGRQPGRRMLLMTSAGFLSAHLAAAQDEVSDAALRAEVVINTLDAKGLAVNLAKPDLSQTTLTLEAPQAMNAVLSGLAVATGGRFVQNTNDLAAGLQRLLTPRAHYVLSFVPAAMPSDGKFHKLAVTADRPHVHLSARPGYFDPQFSILPLPSAAQQSLAAAVRATSTPRRFAVTVSSKLTQVKKAVSALSVDVHVDAARLPFRDRHGRHRENLTLITAVFGPAGKFVVGQEGRVVLALNPATLDKFRQKGLDVRIALDLPPGHYRLREVVREGNRGRITALDHSITVPGIAPEPRSPSPQAPPPPQPLARMHMQAIAMVPLIPPLALSGAWASVHLPDQPLGIAAHDGVLWVCGAHEMIARSSDGGRTWKLLHENKSGEMLFAFAFPMPAKIQAYGTRGRRLVSTDGGVHWHDHENDPRVTITRLRFANPGVGYALTPTGFGRTEDGGAHWQFWSDLNRPLYGSSLAVRGPLSAAVIRGDSEVEWTTDGGAHWTRDNFHNRFTWAAVRVSGPSFELLGMENATGSDVTARLDNGHWNVNTALALDESNCNSQGCLIEGGWVDIRGTHTKVWSEPKDAAEPLTTAWADVGATFCRVSDHLRCRLGEQPWQPPAIGHTITRQVSLLHGKVPTPEELDRTQRRPGCVVLQALIGKDGAIRDVLVASAPSIGLAKAAVAAVRQWHFQAAATLGNTRAVTAQIVILFYIPA